MRAARVGVWKTFNRLPPDAYDEEPLPLARGTDAHAAENGHEGDDVGIVELSQEAPESRKIGSCRRRELRTVRLSIQPTPKNEGRRG